MMLLSSVDARLEVLTEGSEWKLPRDVSTGLMVVTRHWPTYMTNENRSDEVELILSSIPVMCAFCQICLNSFRKVCPKVWHQVVRHKVHMPHCSFICLLNCRDRLRSCDKLLR